MQKAQFSVKIVLKKFTSMKMSPLAIKGSKILAYAL
jgi:hypothetical protein